MESGAARNRSAEGRARRAAGGLGAPSCRRGKATGHSPSLAALEPTPPRRHPEKPPGAIFRSHPPGPFPADASQHPAAAGCLRRAKWRRPRGGKRGRRGEGAAAVRPGPATAVSRRLPAVLSSGGGAGRSDRPRPAPFALPPDSPAAGGQRSAILSPQPRSLLSPPRKAPDLLRARARGRCPPL